MLSGATSSVLQPRFSPGSKYVGWATNVSPFLKLYQRNGAGFSFTEITGLPVADSASASFAWSSTSANFALGGNELRVYRRSGSTLTVTASYPISGVVGIPKDQFQFRDLRAKAGTDKADSAGDIRQAQQQLGHQSVTTTEIYVRKRRGALTSPTK
jgi:integrase